MQETEKNYKELDKPAGLNYIRHMERQPLYEIILEPEAMAITIQSPNGLNDRAQRDMERLQWITVGHGWEMTDRINPPNGAFTRARATFLHEEFVAACRYFDFVNQGILITRKGTA